MAAVTPESPQELEGRTGRYDPARRRRSVRRGRERGCWLYMPAEELRRAGIDPAGPPPLYRTWGTQRGGVLVRLYPQTEEAS
jgi:hypothetical protein